MMDVLGFLMTAGPFGAAAFIVGVVPLVLWAFADDEGWWRLAQCFGAIAGLLMIGGAFVVLLAVAALLTAIGVSMATAP